ncbi:MAG: hypothetical protein CSB47_06325 [Proteobacteria bacterium]|nr:MAG: hypothetical protein CSB47_06325 [Pseudomonadota bacterium]
MKIFKLILLGLVTFIITAIWLTPTAFVAPYIQQAAPNIVISGGSGTIWNGAARNLQINGFDLGEVNWKVRPLKSLTSLSLVSDVNIDGAQLTAAGLAAYAYDRTIRLTDVKFEADASLITRIQPMAKVGGKFQGLINDAELSPAEFPVINGVLNWTQGTLTFPIRLAPGNYRADIHSQDDTITADIESTDAPLALNGTTSINSQWQYQADVLAKAKPGVPPLLNNLLRSAAGGNPSADGSVRIKRKGSIQPIPLYQ